MTDRDELDKQIEGVMKNAGVVGPESKSPRITKRDQFRPESCDCDTTPALSLRVDSTSLIRPISSAAPPPVHGRFVYSWMNATSHPRRRHEGSADEALARKRNLYRFHWHAALAQRQADHAGMSSAPHIHTYKFPEAVTDKVILDLKYEARKVPQRLTSRRTIDAWFAEQKTKVA